MRHTSCGAVLDGRRNPAGEGVAVLGRVGMPAVLHRGDADGSPIGGADAGRRVQRPVDAGDDLHRRPMVGVVPVLARRLGGPVLARRLGGPVSLAVG